MSETKEPIGQGEAAVGESDVESASSESAPAESAPADQRSRVRDRVPAWVIPAVSIVARLGFGGAVLINAGYQKFIMSPTEQIRAVRAYQILPEGVDSFVGIALPIAEILLGLAIVVGFLTRFSAALGGFLMIVFIAGVASAWARGLTIDCGCFGGGGQVEAGQTAYPQEILRDIGFMLMAAWLVVFGPGRFAVDTLLGRTSARETTQ